VSSGSRGRPAEAGAGALAAGTEMIITTREDHQEAEAESEDVAGVGTDITAGEEVEVATEEGHEVGTGGEEVEADAGQGAEGGHAPGLGTGRRTTGSLRREIRKKVAMAKKSLSRRKPRRMAARRMGPVTSRKDQNPKAGREKDPSHAIGRGQGHDHERGPRGQGLETEGGAPGLATDGGQDPDPGIGEDLDLGITRVRRARGTGMRGRKSRGITIRRRRDTRTRKRKRPRQWTWRYPILPEQGKSATLTDFSVEIIVHFTTIWPMR